MKNNLNFCSVCEHNKYDDLYSECCDCVGECSAFDPSEKLKQVLRNYGYDIHESKDVKKPILILGFPGIGKSYMAEKLKNEKILISDSDSSKFDKNDFPKNYINHIIHLIEDKYDLIFVSTHEDVRKAISENSYIRENACIYIVYPSLELKDFWIKRLYERGSSPEFCNLIDKNYNKWISDIMTENLFSSIEIEYEKSPNLYDNLYKIPIYRTNYKLYKIIYNIK